ncbi:MAG: hypothetical protein C0582_02005 [Alphaproteobacteria bacterium]|nr:MAG: hypothetical protein C0582_02005 [Alphaproteobacteria bacterium]
MRIVVYGLTHAGITIATFFSEAGQDVIVIDENEEAIAELNAKIDAHCVCSNAASISELQKLNLSNIDLFVASSNKDENNLLAAHFAKSIFQARFSVCYLMQTVFAPRHRQKTLQQSQLAIDKIISPEKAIAQHIVNNIAHDAFINVYPIPDLSLYFCVYEFEPENPFIGDALKEWLDHQDLKITPLILKTSHAYDVAHPKDQIRAGHVLFFCCDNQGIEAFNRQNMTDAESISNYVVLGGGRFGAELARRLEKQESVKNLKVIEKDLEKAKTLSQTLEQAIVLNGDALDPSLLEEAGVDKNTLVLCLMDHDENNILSALLVRKMQANTMVLIHTPSYFDVLSSLGLTSLVRTREIIVSEMLSFIPFKAVKILRVFGAYNWLLCRIHIHADSSFLSQNYEKIERKGHIKIAGVIRDEIWMPAVTLEDKMLREKDKVIFIAHKSMIRELDRIF